MSMAYRGDVYPYVPVANELAGRGHEVTFVVPREFHSEFANERFACVHSGSDFSPRELNKHGKWLARWGMRFGGARLLELYLGTFTVPFLEEQFTAVHDALDGADALFCHSTAGIVGSMAAEACSAPWISGDLFPMLIPTASTTPFPGLPSLGPMLNRVSWQMARSTRPYRLSYADAFADFRRAKGLEDTPRSMIDLRISPHLNLGMASPKYVPVADDWPDNYVMTGFTSWDSNAAPMPDGLEEFLGPDPSTGHGTYARNPEAPILITLGTLAAAAHPERFVDAVKAADAVGLRTVTLCSTEDSVAAFGREGFDPQRHGQWAFAPLGNVLGRVRGVVHAGSHGTNSAALAAGLPSVIMPSIFDQVWHANRQEKLNTGIHVRNPDQLDGAMNRLAHDTSLGHSASNFGLQLAEEPNGSITAADRIEQFLEN